MDSDIKKPLNVISCGECRTGKMTRRGVTYYAWSNQELITVPDFPAWVCDICGRREYDLNALHHLNIVLRTAENREFKRPRTVPPPAEKPPPQTGRTE
jgi:YgiT-type zinc finger domain-containing protein